MSEYNYNTHERLHTASIFMQNVSDYLIDRHDIPDDEMVFAEQAFQALFDLYQLIGSKHIVENIDE